MELVLADAVFDGEERCGAAGRDADLGVDVLYVMVDGLGGDYETVGDLAGGETECEEPEDVDLAGAQSGRLGGSSGSSMPGRGQNPLDCLPVQASGAHGPEFACCVRGSERGAMRAV